MYPCNYRYNFFKKKSISSLLQYYSPIKLYIDKWITFTDYKNSSQKNLNGAPYYYPISLVTKIKLRMFKSYIKTNISKFIVYASISILVLGSIFL